MALLSRAMVNKPEILLLDEPMSGLDARARSLVMEMVEDWSRTEGRLIAAVHHAADIPGTITDIAELSHGRIIRFQPYELGSFFWGE